MSSLGKVALSEFSDVLYDLESLRKKAKQGKTIVRAAIILVSTVMSIGMIVYYVAIFNYSLENANPYDPYAPMADQEYWNIIYLFMGFMAIVVGPFIWLYIRNQKAAKAYQEQYYQDLLIPLIQKSYPSISYQAKGKIQNNKVLKSNRYYKFAGIEQRLCKHYISGSLGNIGFEIGKTNIKAVRSYGKPSAANKTGAVGTENFFDGVVMYISPNSYSAQFVEQMETASWKNLIDRLAQYWDSTVLQSLNEDGSLVIDFKVKKEKSFLEPPINTALLHDDFAQQLDAELGLLLDLADSLNSAA